jgi:hypothetical protein
MGMKSEAAEEKAVESCTEQAMQSIVDDLMTGGKIAGRDLYWHLMDEWSLEDPCTRAILDACVRAILTGQLSEIKDEAERIIRRYYADRTELHDRAYEIAHPEEQGT